MMMGTVSVYLVCTWCVLGDAITIASDLGGVLLAYRWVRACRLLEKCSLQ